MTAAEQIVASGGAPDATLPFLMTVAVAAIFLGLFYRWIKNG